ncbi:SDR family oxidoreductase [Streptomyces sp. NBC_00638]|uniref:SDR family NAD(P)-dependent oxidoreductase n=1 Tax=unclassified Streptomyces TaxID=2593676 RepID=UPI00224C85B2|nr:SDR family oxidoreductase [Streptomyces sp. NBC_00638]MCX5009027.1 SDR family oxidoreductase [Streptomyces sp. NBC_00638]
MTRAPVVVVTGSTRGIGHGLARSFLDRGCRVVVSGRGARTVKEAAAALGAPADRLLGRAADVTDRGQVQDLWDAALDTFGGVDVWINNAGATTVRRPLWDLPDGALEAVVATNLLGTAHGSAVALNGFLARGRGRLWNMEGLGSDGRVLPGLGAYGTTKCAVTYLTRALAADLRERAGAAPHDVRALCLSPGMVVTDLLLHDYGPAEYAKVRKVLNILADRVDTVAPWLADRVLADRTRNGGRVAWLTRRKAAARFAAAGFRTRDILPPAPIAPADAPDPGRGAGHDKEETR